MVTLAGILPPKEPPAAQPDDKTLCDYCGSPFTQYRSNQHFCSLEHRRAFEKIIQRIGRKIYPEIRDGVREILEATRSKP